jgi:hypothetical protein
MTPYPPNLGRVRRTLLIAGLAAAWAGCASSLGTPGPTGAGAAGAGGQAGTGTAGAPAAMDAGLDGTPDAALEATDALVSTDASPDAFPFPMCGAQDSYALPPDLGAVTDSGYSQSGYHQWEGTITTLEATGMIVMSGTDSVRLAWRGPDLTGAFALGDAVQMVGVAGGWTIVRSDRATAAVLSYSMWHVLPTTPGSTTAGLPGQAAPTSDFPSILHKLVSCCSGVYVGPGYGSRCSYADLIASYDGSSIEIARGATGSVGPWQVTDVDATYTIGTEYVWRALVTFLGPATPRAKPPGDPNDGGAGLEPL